MADGDLQLPGFSKPLESPESYLAGMLRSFGEASQALGRATDRLVLRLAKPRNGGDPDYQLQTLDGGDAAAFSGSTHDLLHEDITVRIEEADLQDQRYTLEQVKDWLNALNGEGAGGGQLNPILTDKWTRRDISDPRD
jgi:hypothetical protein